MANPHQSERITGDESPTARVIQGEEAVLKAEALQSAIFNSAYFSSIATDEKGVIQIFNVGAERMLGYTATDVVNKITPAEISDPQETIARAKALSEELQIKIAPGFEAVVFKASRGIEDIYKLTYIRKDGSRFPAVVSVTALRDGKDGIIGYLLVVTANTAGERTDQATAWLAAIVNSSNDAIIGKDLNSIVTSWNIGAEKIFGYTANEMVGTSILRLIPSDRQDEEQRIIDRVKNGTIVEHFETLRLAKDGRQVDITVSVSPIRDSSGKIVGASKVARDITERKRLEEELLLFSQRRLSLALEAAQIGDWELDLVTKVARRSPRHDQIFGYPELLPEWNYALFLKHVHPEDRLRVDRAFQDSVASGQDWYIECRIIRADHEMRWIFVRGRFFKDESDQPKRLIGLIGDITERRGGEAALQESEGAFRMLAESIPQIVWSTRPDGWNTYFNQRWSEYTGLTQEESRGHGWNIPFHPDDQKRSSDAWQHAIQTGGVYSLEVRLRRADAVYRWWLVRGLPLREANGGIMRWFGTCTDIHDLKMSEEKTQLISKRIGSMTDEVRDYLVIMLEPDGRVATWNKGAERSTGYKAEEIVGQHFRRFYLPSDVADHKPELELERAAAEGRVENENWRLRKDGSRFWANVVVTALRDSEGKINGFVKIARDLTARKEAEEKIHQLNAELERRIIERTTELEAANKELEAFSYSVSHDLRAPLRAVDGFSQAVLEDYGSLLPPEGHHYLKNIREGAQRMGTLIDDLLAFSRLSRAPLSKRAVNTNGLVRRVLEDLSPEQRNRKIEIRIGELPSCECDGALLKQVWTNLLSNAMKYTRQRSPAEIEIGCKMGQENIYFVRDNGAGFDMRYVDKLFGVFQRLHRADEFEGTGVGLAIVQRIVHRHGGRIWAEASLNGGATFSFTLKEEGKL
jgi:PAS domain S-box-containing protein